MSSVAVSKMQFNKSIRNKYLITAVYNLGSRVSKGSPEIWGIF